MTKRDHALNALAWIIAISSTAVIIYGAANMIATAAW